MKTKGLGLWVIIFGFVFPQAKTLRRIWAGSGWEVFFINFEKLASHGKSWQYFYNFYSKKWHDFS